MEAAAAEKARIEREEADRKQKEAELARKAEEERARQEAERLAREKENESKNSAPATRLSQYFQTISNASNVNAANASINEALSLFASPDTPVLIVISDAGGIKDYDKPTTIRNYLNYLKDQKKNINTVSAVKTDTQGKITELELRKTF